MDRMRISALWVIHLTRPTKNWLSTPPRLVDIVRLEHPCPSSPPSTDVRDRVSRKRLKRRIICDPNVRWWGCLTPDMHTNFVVFVDVRFMADPPPPPSAVVHIGSHTPPFDRTSLTDGPLLWIKLTCNFIHEHRMNKFDISTNCRPTLAYLLIEELVIKNNNDE